jgi:hypothetical protein
MRSRRCGGAPETTIEVPGNRLILHFASEQALPSSPQPLCYRHPVRIGANRYLGNSRPLLLRAIAPKHDAAAGWTLNIFQLLGN